MAAAALARRRTPKVACETELREDEGIGINMFIPESHTLLSAPLAGTRPSAAMSCRNSTGASAR